MKTMNEPIIQLTQAGYEKLAQELDELRTVRRPRAHARMRNARELDRAIESSACEDALSEQAFVEGRIRDLELMLVNARIIERRPEQDVVALGARVAVVDDGGARAIYTIVGSIEADPRRGLISNESPVGRALMGKRVGETASVASPGGTFDLRVEISRCGADLGALSLGRRFGAIVGVGMVPRGGVGLIVATAGRQWVPTTRTTGASST